ncbi:MAG: LmbE family N-acetylglucosaminyl deacetylase [Planctomycetota bacterium]|jgi:LmbE family N-acetylglucosaminyl deacetylase
MRSLAALLCLASAVVAQRWHDTCGRSPAGILTVRQAARDCAADSLVLLVASHPDDRYLLPTVWLRLAAGYRVAVLLTTRGGGGQNSLGPETGDALERIRTLETEAGCALAGASVWYLNREDAGYCRSAEETYADWGREGSLRDLVRLLRKIRPDAVLTTHHAEEGHGHDLAIVDLLPEAIEAAADPNFGAVGECHTIPVFLLGGGSTVSVDAVKIDADRLDPDRGAALRRTAYDILRGTHVSPGLPAQLDAVFAPVLVFEPRKPAKVDATGPRPFALPSILDADRWPGAPERAISLDTFFRNELPQLLHAAEPPIAKLLEVLVELRELQETHTLAPEPNRDVIVRLGRRIMALEQLVLALARVQIEVTVPPGAVAIEDEDFSCGVRLLTGRGELLPLRAEGLNGALVKLTDLGKSAAPASSSLAEATIRVAASKKPHRDPMAHRFKADRFVPPVVIRFWVTLQGIEIPVNITVPVEQRPPAELTVVPRMLLLPHARNTVQFSVEVKRNSLFPIEGDLELRGTANYAITKSRHRVVLRDQRTDLFSFEVGAPLSRSTGVDVLRISLGDTAVVLPVHNIDVKVPSTVRVGVLRSRDDTLASLLVGLGMSWSELTDADIATADLSVFDTIVVDIRALRDRAAARNAFSRLLAFAKGKGRRLVIFYQKNVEFHPKGEAFRGAPFEPFHISKNRVTREDAPVKVLMPDHILMTHPNVIRPSDWDGWVQERALYLPAVYSDKYDQILEFGDPGQDREHGSLLYAQTGDGEYVYCALALWRQLKTLHAGSVRILVNLLTPAGK